jgi:hypothetical protein
MILPIIVRCELCNDNDNGDSDSDDDGRPIADHYEIRFEVVVTTPLLICFRRATRASRSRVLMEEISYPLRWQARPVVCACQGRSRLVSKVIECIAL